MIETTLIKHPFKPAEPKYPPLAPGQYEELVALRIFRDASIEASIEAGEIMASQEKRIEELTGHMLKMHDVLYNAIANTTHLVPAFAPMDTKKPRTKPDETRIRKQKRLDK